MGWAPPSTPCMSISIVLQLLLVLFLLPFLGLSSATAHAIATASSSKRHLSFEEQRANQRTSTSGLATSPSGTGTGRSPPSVPKRGVTNTTASRPTSKVGAGDDSGAELQQRVRQHRRCPEAPTPPPPPTSPVLPLEDPGVARCMARAGIQSGSIAVAQFMYALPRRRSSESPPPHHARVAHVLRQTLAPVVVDEVMESEKGREQDNR